MASASRVCIAAAFWLALAVSVKAWTSGRQVLPGHVPAAVTGLTPVGDLPDTNCLNLAIGLPLRHQDALKRLLHDLYDPASPRYRRFLKPQEFADQFGPSEEDYRALIAFAQAHHLQILRTHSNRVLLDVAASTAQVREVFHVNLKVYRHPSEGRNFYAPDREPSLELKVPLLHVSGLDNYDLPRPGLGGAARGADGGASQPAIGSGPNGTYLGNDFRAAYAPGVSLDGAGQSVALVEFATYYTNDILAYESMARIAPVAITNVIVAGFDKPPGGSSEEVEADIEMAVSMAPGLSQVLVYECPDGATSVIDDMINQIATDDLANQISCSWLFVIDQVTDQIFQQYEAQGQSFFDACGDSGAYDGDMAAKEGDPYITVVGGTVLMTSGPGGTWTGETAWRSGSGGVSSSYPIPYWQEGVNMSSNQGSLAWRNSPDVALTAKAILLIYDNGITNGETGTSCAAPLWAGFTALVNQQAANNGGPPVGFLNPALYAIGQSSLYASCFHDILMGNNTNVASPTNYFARAGFDLCTGWGAPTGQALINALAPPDSLVILPASGLFFGMTNNGMAAGEMRTLMLTNSGATSLNWSLETAPSWVQFSATNGVIPADSAASLIVTISPEATNLAPGGFAADLVLSNLKAGVAHGVPIFLEMSDPLIVTPATGMAVSGPVGGPFNLTSQTISLSNASVGTIQWTAGSTTAFLSVVPGGGTLAPGQTAGVLATLSASASNLLINSFSGSMAFMDLSTGSAQTVPCSLAVGNGGFETGSFADWTFTGNSNANFVGGTPDYINYIYSGQCAAVMGQPTNLATLAQSLPTTPGRLYLISFWLDNPVGKNPNEFEVNWNGNSLFNQTNMPKFSWTNMEFVVAATAAATSLEFLFLNEPDAFGFDDVSVTAIAPPAFGAVVFASTPGASSAVLNWSATPGFSYQLQYATNLAAPLWINSGGPIVATGNTAAAATSSPRVPQQFYRVVLTLP
jgi:hypothetical protein